MKARWVESGVRGLRYSRAGVIGAASMARDAHTLRAASVLERLQRTGTCAATSSTILSGLAPKVVGYNGRISFATPGAVRLTSNESHRWRNTHLALFERSTYSSASRPPSSSVLGLRPREFGVTSNMGALSKFSTSTDGTTAEKGVGGAPVAEADVAESVKPAKEEPRHSHIEMPSITDAEKVATLTSWNVKVGDAIKVGDVVCEIELEQFSVGVKVETPGFLAEILVEAGTENVPVGADMGTIVHSEEDIAHYQRAQVRATEDKPVTGEPQETFSWKDVLKDILRLRKENKLSEDDASTLMSLARKKDGELLQAFEGCFVGDKYSGEIDDDLFLAQAIDIAKARRKLETKDESDTSSS